MPNIPSQSHDERVAEIPRLKYLTVLSADGHPEGLSTLVLSPTLEDQERYDVESYAFHVDSRKLLELARKIRAVFGVSTPQDPE